MDRLQAMEVFVAVAEAGSFARAGRRLRVSAASVTRAVAALETRLGVRLLNRTTRSVVPTEAGLRFLENARSLIHGLELAERDAAGEMAEPAGTLTLSAPVTFGRNVVAPLAGELLRAHPRLSVSLLLTDRYVGLVEEGVDAALRIGELPDSALVARRLGEVRRMLVASPGYLARGGVPGTPAELRGHAVVAFSGLLPNREWRHLQDGRIAAIRLQPRLEVNDGAAALAAAEAGEGITLALSYMVAGAIAAGRLVPVLEAHAPPPVPVQLVHLPARLVRPGLRAFLDLATPRLRERLATDLAVTAPRPLQPLKE